MKNKPKIINLILKSQLEENKSNRTFETHYCRYTSQIMSADKYPSIFWRQTRATVYTVLHNYSTTARCMYKQYPLFREIMLGYLSADIIEANCFPRAQLERKTVRFSEQTMFKNKYPSVFLHQFEAIVFIIFQIFFRNTRAFENWRTSFGYFGHLF